MINRILLTLPLQFALACSPRQPPGANGGLREITVGGHPARVRVAESEEARTRGLMFKEDLGDADGMLFVFDGPEIRNFWMKNTPLPLTLAYLDDEGIIFQVEYLEPHDTMTSHQSGRATRYALELERGWLRHRGLGVGSKVDLCAFEK